MRNKYFKIFFIVLYVTAFAIPTYIFFSIRGGLAFLYGSNFRQTNLALFPLMGLYAFTLIWAQIMIGANHKLLRRFIPNIMSFHRQQGVFALLFALVHPTLLLLGLGMREYYKFEFVDPSLKIFIWFGYFQLFLIVCTAGTALLRNTSLLAKHWRKVHYLNYVIFVSVWIHSWFLGTDIQATSLKYLWIFYGATFVVTVWHRFKGLALFYLKRIIRSSSYQDNNPAS